MSAGTRWATRCNACGTSFRVQEEQLAASDGYVRCGRCDAVFNARSTLFDLDAPAVAAPLMPAGPGSETRTDWVEAARTQEEAMPASPVLPSAPSDPAMAHGHASSAETKLAASPRGSTRAEQPPVAAGEPTEPVWSDADDAVDLMGGRAEPDLREPDVSRMLELLSAQQGTGSGEAVGTTPVTDVGAGLAGSAQTSSAEPATWRSLREHKPRKPESRPALAALSVLTAMLVLALPLHWAWIEREPLRAQHAELDALLADKASLAARGWRHLDGLQVSASSLRATPQGGAYQLELSVHNRAAHRLAMPWLDLSLSDAKGQPVLRRALDPALLGPSHPLSGGEQRKLQIVFRVERAAPVGGYEIGLFHP